MGRGETLSDLALYRKYRSATFDDVMGQPHITETLKNAVASGKLSHAYLFTGPRGTGKTSVARLLARSVNCSASDPATKPCGVCISCKTEIGSHLDLIEIDAASNRGIDDARALRDKISLAPSLGKYKVYIIDEVHMLTTEAFNALLKTLEEPPAHAIFILATTEAHKLPETIVSRTQRFQFRPIATPDLILRLSHIAEQEKIVIEPEAIAIIAEASRGGFRDAISLLDQAAGSGQQPLTAAIIRNLMGWSDAELIDGIIGAMLGGDAAGALVKLDAALGQGAQAGQLIHQLINQLRQRLRSSLANDTGRPAELHAVLRCIDELLRIVKSPLPELALEATVVQLAIPTTTPTELAATQPLVAPVAAPSPKPAPPTPEPASQPSPVIAEGQPDQELWMKTLAQIKQHNNPLYSLLRSSSVRFEGDQVILGCRFSFFLNRLKETKNIQIIEQSLARVYGRRIKAVPQLEASPQPAAAAVATAEGDLVASALEILGGEVIDG